MHGSTNPSIAPSSHGGSKVTEAGILAFRPIHDTTGAIVDLVCTKVSEEAASILHRTPSDIVRGSIMEIHPSDLDDTLFRSYAKVVETGRPLKIETEYIRNGVAHIWSVSASREAEDLVLVISDITEQQRQAMLLVERDRLKAAGGFIRLLGHEVRNPLTNILLAVGELESEGYLQPDQLLYLNMVRRNAERIDQLISELLRSSREREMTMAPGSLKAVLSAALANVADRCELVGARCTKLVDPGLEQVPMESAALTLAFTNLFVNAVEAMELGKGELSVRAERSKGRIQVIVSDNGKGMSEEDLQRLFQPFFTGRKGGLGFGLTEARNIFNAHGILLTAYSTLGNGTTFRMLFPPAEGTGIPERPSRMDAHQPACSGSCVPADPRVLSIKGVS
jgi:signal transduction histidine kinase